MASLSSILRSKGRKIHKNYGHIFISPVSRGTWSVNAQYGRYPRRKTFRRHTLEPFEIEEAVGDALRFLAREGL